MSKLTDKQIVIFSVVLFALIYITIHTNMLSNFLHTIRPFINGFILAYLTDIFASKVEKKISFKHARGLSILIVYMMLITIFALLLGYMIPILHQNIQLFIHKLPDYLDQSEFLTLNFFLNTFSLSEVTSRYGANLLEFTGYARAATSSIVNGALSFVVSVYVLLTKDSIFRFTGRLVKLTIPNHADTLKRYMKQSHLVFQQFLLAQLFASLILGFLAGITLAFLNVNYAILIGTLIALLNVIPLFGAIVGIVIAVVIIFLTNSPVLAWASLAFLLFLQQIDATVITPKLMGNVLNLNPIVIILAMIIGTHYFGFIGILFAVPVTVMIREMLKERFRV
ncbi:MAG: AI-2E family transporter [Defluviitaleaceae bacterium]|nr:AI-2E family transporter [Defluviitaleaceae bacterium]